MCRQFCLLYNYYPSIDDDSIGLVMNADAYMHGYHDIVLARPASVHDMCVIDVVISRSSGTQWSMC